MFVKKCIALDVDSNALLGARPRARLKQPADGAGAKPPPNGAGAKPAGADASDASEKLSSAMYC